VEIKKKAAASSKECDEGIPQQSGHLQFKKGASINSEQQEANPPCKGFQDGILT
jgi:hypothetical protein